jgi:hypothetical protein
MNTQLVAQEEKRHINMLRIGKYFERRIEK